MTNTAVITYIRVSTAQQGRSGLGIEAQRQALEYGVKVSGCTVHLVDENLDAGPILAQAVVPIGDDDTVETLSARILLEEHRIYIEAVQLILSGKYRIEGRRTIALPSGQ